MKYIEQSHSCHISKALSEEFLRNLGVRFSKSASLTVENLTVENLNYFQNP